MSIAKRISIVFYGVLAVAAAETKMAHALTATLTPSADASMRDNSPNTSYGDSNPLIVGNSKEPFTVHNHGLLKFDLTSIPTNATITSATLTVQIFRSNTDVSEYDLNRILVDWNEYEVSWNSRSASTPWLAGGGQSGTEYVSAASVSAPVDDSIFSSAGMVSDVQLWVRNSATNFGWMMLPTGNLLGTGKQLGSRESEYTSILTVEYTLTPPINPPVLFGTGLAENGFRFSFNANSNRAYAVEFCDVLATTNWSTLTNIPAQPVDGIIDITNAVSSTQRYYRVRIP